jgi:hypothetical protein
LKESFERFPVIDLDLKLDQETGNLIWGPFATSGNKTAEQLFETRSGIRLAQRKRESGTVKHRLFIQRK